MTVVYISSGVGETIWFLLNKALSDIWSLSTQELVGLAEQVWNKDETGDCYKYNKADALKLKPFSLIIHENQIKGLLKEISQFKIAFRRLNARTTAISCKPVVCNLRPANRIRATRGKLLFSNIVRPVKYVEMNLAYFTWNILTKISFHIWENLWYLKWHCLARSACVNNFFSKVGIMKSPCRSVLTD